MFFFYLKPFFTLHITTHPNPLKHPDIQNLRSYQNENNFLPEIKNTVDISQYDIIFVGTPAWFSTVAMPVKTFLNQNNFKGKIIIPFITHGGGGGYDIAVDMDDISNGKVIQNALVVNGKGSDSLDNDIKNWLKSLKK